MEIEKPITQQLNTKGEAFAISTSILDDLITDIHNSFQPEEWPSAGQMKITELPSNQKSQKFSEEKQQEAPKKYRITIQIPDHVMLRHYFERHNMQIIRTIDYQSDSQKKTLKIYHPVIHKQYVPNICGYHLIFNISEVLKTILSRNLDREPTITKSIAFWQFKNHMSRFLFDYGKNVVRNIKQWPYRHYDTFFGDFERSHLKAAYNNPEFGKLFINHQKELQVFQHTWEYQFGRSISLEHYRNELQEQINEFRKSNEKDVHYVFCISLGVTNHWALFVAEKLNNQTDFWFMDSRNRDYLTWSREECNKWVDQENIRRKEQNKIPWTNFQQMVNENCILDFQSSVQILCQLFCGDNTIQQFQNNAMFEIFSKPFFEFANNHDIKKTIELNSEETVLAFIDDWANNYQHNIKDYFKNKDIIQTLNRENQHYLKVIQNWVHHISEEYHKNNKSHVIHQINTFLPIESKL